MITKKRQTAEADTPQSAGKVNFEVDLSNKAYLKLPNGSIIYIGDNAPNVTQLIADVNQLQSNELKILYFEVIDISAGTTGTITLPSGATISLEEFGADQDAVLSTLSPTGQPLFETPYTSGNPITATLDIDGDWIASDNYPDDVAIVFAIIISFEDFQNLDQDNYLPLDETSFQKQPLSVALTEIASLSPSNDALIQRKAGIWVDRTLAQLWTDLKDLVVTFTNKTISLVSNTITGTKAQFNTAVTDGDFIFEGDARLTDSRNRKIFVQENTTQSHTGNTDETIKINKLIPAGSMGDNGVLWIDSQCTKSGVVETAQFRYYLGPTSGSLDDATLLGITQLTTTNRTLGFQRRMANKNSESLNEVYPVTATNAVDTTASTVAMTTINIDTSVDLYLIQTIKMTVGTETGSIRNFQAYINKQ